MSRILKNKIQTKKAKIAIIGLGYVGLPLAVSFAKAGYQVLGLDTDQDRVNRVNTAKNYIADIKAQDLRQVTKAKKCIASTSFDGLPECDVVIICVPTPLKRRYTPDIKYIMSAVKTTCQHLKKNALVVLESTTYPGTTEELILPEFVKIGKKLGKDFFLAFSPERIDPGNKVYDVTEIPKIVGGVEKVSGELTRILYEKVIKEVHLVSSAKTAEMTKLLENTFRIINIGWINEIAVMSHEMGIDVWEVIEAAKTKPFGFMPFYPGLGVGGHCIPDDPLYLYWKARHHGVHSKFIKLAADVNSDMPAYAVDRIRKALQIKKKNLKGTKILVLGATYKKDVKDLRKSPAMKLISLLQDLQSDVQYHDPIIPYLSFAEIDLVSVDLTPAQIKKYDCVVVAVNHTKVDYALVKRNAKLIFDVCNLYKSANDKKIIRL